MMEMAWESLNGSNAKLGQWAIQNEGREKQEQRQTEGETDGSKDKRKQRQTEAKTNTSKDKRKQRPTQTQAIIPNASNDYQCKQ